MAVVSMEKVRLLVHGTDVDAALDIVQKTGALEFRATKLTDTTEPEVYFPHAQLLPRVQHAVNWLAPYAPEVSTWQKLRQGARIELKEAQVTKQLQDTDVVAAVADDLEKLQVEFAETEEKVRELEEQRALLTEWKALPIKLSELATKRTVTLLVKGHQATEQHTLKSLIEGLCAEQGTPHIVTEVSVKLVALTLPCCDAQVVAKAKQIIEEADGEIITPPAGTETPEVELVAIEERLAKARGDLALLHDQAEHFAITHYKNLQVAAEVLSWQRDRFAVVTEAAATHYTVIFDGWLRADHRATIEAAFKAKGIAAVFAHLEPEEGEEPPVEISNSNFVRPFEAVTRLYGMPGYKDLDPTVFLAGFFFLFFGLSLTDVGYGLFLMIASVVILTLFKVSESTRLFAKLLLFVGFATVLVGMLFGGYLGISPEYLPASLKAIQVFDPIGNPLPVFYLALGLGVLQVMVGMLVKIYSEYKQGRLMTGVLDQGPWLFTFVIAILYVCRTVVESGSVESGFGYKIINSLAFLNTAQLINLIYVGLVLIVLSSGRKGETIFAKIKDSLSGLYDSIGYFSDILSYSRLLALGLATTALAFAVNMIAGMVFDKESYISYILAGIILAIGHLFTLAVNTLGAFIHSARLQFVEFFGKFIAGTGKEFAPLSRTEKHVTIIDD